MGLSRFIVLLLGAAATAFGADATPPRAAPTLDDLLDTTGIVDAAVSPSGRYLATIVRSARGDRVVVQEAPAGEPQVLTRVGIDDAGPDLEARITTVYWKTDDRVLFRVSVQPPDRAAEKHLKLMNLQKVGTRIFSIRRDGTGLVRLLQGNADPALYLAFDLGALRSLLPADPDDVLLVVRGYSGRSLYRVNVDSGKGEMVEPASGETWDWWLDLDGRPVVRVDASFGMMRFYHREDGGGWKKFYSVRLREIKPSDEYEAVGPSDRPGRFYVLARPAGAQRRAVYLHDLGGEGLGTPLAQHPDYDVVSADVSRDGRRITRYCYVAHVRICVSPDAVMNEHLASLRAKLGDAANLDVIGDSADGHTLLLRVDGPGIVPTYYLSRVGSQEISLIGQSHEATAGKALPSARVVEYVSRDGTKLTGYLTLPPGATDAGALPLVVMPHGGPEARDSLRFDVPVEYLAARGYAVFQPNFRGSDGFGLAFTESGYGQWGRMMQDDITDGVRLLVERKIVDPARMCIVGASYGGYAALAGAAFTPDLFRCAVSMSGPADLGAFLKYRAKLHGRKSELYAYWKTQIGDPDVDAARIADASPALHVDRIKASILLIHGDDDDVVPYSQSRDLEKRLDKSGRKTELVTLEGEGHQDWSTATWRRVLTAIGGFLDQNLGEARP